jgi:hypothetical protein
MDHSLPGIQEHSGLNVSFIQFQYNAGFSKILCKRAQFLNPQAVAGSQIALQLE